MHLFVCLLGADSCQCGGEAKCFFGRRRQLVFPSNSGGLGDATLTPHQEPQLHTSTVGLHNDCYSYAVIFQCIGSSQNHTFVYSWLSAFVFYGRFHWSIPEPDQELISVEPDAGELHPNESSVSEQIRSCIYSNCMSGLNRFELFYTFHNLQVQIWSFSPLAEETYTLKPTLTFWPMQTPGCNMSQLTLKVVGEGSKGFIEVRLKLYVSFQE